MSQLQVERQWWTEAEANLGNTLDHMTAPKPASMDTPQAREVIRQVRTALLTATQCREWLDLRVAESG